MNLNDLTIELIDFLNDSGNYRNFIDFMHDKAYSELEIEEALEKAEQGELY